MALTVTSIGAASGKGVTSVVITLGSNIPAGCTIFAAIATVGSVLSNITDSFGQPHWVGGNGLSTANGTILLDWAWNASAMNSGNTITVTPSSGTFTCSVYAWYVTGLASAASPVDTAQTSSGSGTAVSLTTGSLAQAAEYCVGAVAVAGPSTETYTNDTNYTLASYRTGTTGGTDITVDVGMRTVMSTSPATYAPTLGTSENFAAYLATFKVIDVAINLTGVAGTGSVGAVGHGVSKSVTGVAGTGSVGTLSVAGAKTVNLSGVAVTGSPGTVTALHSGNVAIAGAASTLAAGSLKGQLRPNLTGTAASTSAGTFGLSRGVSLRGAVIYADYGVLYAPPHPQLELRTALARTSAGSFVISESIARTLPGANSVTQAGALTDTVFAALGSAAISANPGDFYTVITGFGLTLADLMVICDPPIDESRYVSLRWSDSRGQHYGNAVLQSLGDEGNYLANMQWRRLGMGRDRVFELSWTVPCETAITGAFIDIEMAST